MPRVKPRVVAHKVSFCAAQSWFQTFWDRWKVLGWAGWTPLRVASYALSLIQRIYLLAQQTNHFQAMSTTTLFAPAELQTTMEELATAQQRYLDALEEHVVDFCRRMRLSNERYYTNYNDALRHGCDAKSLGTQLHDLLDLMSVTKQRVAALHSMTTNPLERPTSQALTP